MKTGTSLILATAHHAAEFGQAESMVLLHALWALEQNRRDCEAWGCLAALTIDDLALHERLLMHLLELNPGHAETRMRLQSLAQRGAAPH